MDNNQISTLDDFNGLLSTLNPEDVGQGAETNVEPPQEETPVEPTGIEETTPAAEPTVPAEEPEAPLANQKANKAFAEMRTLNRTQQAAITKLCKVANIDPNSFESLESLVGHLETVERTAQAKQMNVDPAVLERLATLERTNQAYEQQRLAQLANDGFNKVVADYGLDDKSLIAFATQLQQAGINPYEAECDLTREYKLLNMDSIIKRERDLAVREALAKQQKATSHSTTPSKTQGKSTQTGGEEKINTMAQFNSLLRDLR